jgi:hypothetical protein
MTSQTAYFILQLRNKKRHLVITNNQAPQRQSGLGQTVPRVRLDTTVLANSQIDGSLFN